jgi:RecB family exonuclease
VARERLLLRIAAAAARSRFVVSYSRMDAEQSRPRVPSFYAMEVVRAGEGRLPDLRVFGERAARAAPARLGWPAPCDWRQAVDDAEYDLALLGQSPGKGSGRYLIDANPILARSLRTRARRWRNFWSAADGIVDPDVRTLEVLASHGLSSRGHSPSSLQHYAACPYRFLLHAIHRFKRREEPVALEQMDPLTRGSLFHAVQFELFRELEQQGWDNLLDLADRVLDRVAARYEEDLAPAIPRVWRTEVEDLRTDLRGWLHDLWQLRAEWQPLRYEFSFGLPLGRDRDPHSAAEEVEILNGVRLHGSMDLVERHRTRGALRITDHKTGKAPEQIPAFIGGGALLQPVLYGLAAEKLLGAPVECGRLFYCTQRGGYLAVDIPLTDAARRRAALAMETIDSAIRSGFLPAAPQKDACEICDYRLVCGPYEATRVRRKLPERLEPLVNLRNTP